jgi:hypothetical protein
VKGGGFFRRAAIATLGVLSLGTFKPQPLVSTSSSVSARVPSGQTKAPTSQVTRSQQARLSLKGRSVWRSYASSQVIPPFKFCHGRTMVARYRVYG